MIPELIRGTPLPWHGRRTLVYRLNDGSIGVQVERWAMDRLGYRWRVTHKRIFAKTP